MKVYNKTGIYLAKEPVKDRVASDNWFVFVIQFQDGSTISMTSRSGPAQVVMAIGKIIYNDSRIRIERVMSL